MIFVYKANIKNHYHYFVIPSKSSCWVNSNCFCGRYINFIAQTSTCWLDHQPPFIVVFSSCMISSSSSSSSATSWSTSSWLCTLLYLTAPYQGSTQWCKLLDTLIHRIWPLLGATWFILHCVCWFVLLHGAWCMTSSNGKLQTAAAKECSIMTPEFWKWAEVFPFK